MNEEQKKKIEIQEDIREMSEIIGMLIEKYKDEPLIEDAQAVFLHLSSHIERALNIKLQ